ncbi:GldG family protein [Alteromonas sp. ASW11-130]|uniref:GldG family protein n=1 Tax=Alteromonas sp. ASW11-130 TaxID=3015775 RepID=UPI0022427B4C|nr:Gldg family protein [Alteromonas sp. ASW11-130]MCW8091536.1 GldG family protein [Alteromonas sp. ASW11-130]
MNRVSAIASLTLLTFLFVGLVIVNNQLLGRFRVDLTENQVYSLSEGSKAVLSDLDEPVTLYFFFSDTTSKGMTSLRNYADRVESLLKEFAQSANGKVVLKVIDPEPFSEAEDQASKFGLTAASIGAVGESVYFGLAGTNAFDDQFSISFFDPLKEQFLEYDIAKLIYQLSDPEPVKVSLITDLPVSGGQNPMTGEYTGPMVFYEQLSQLFYTEVIAGSATTLPEQTDVVILAHAKDLSPSLSYAVDQFAMNNGRIIAFVDPHYESDPMAMMGAIEPNRSSTALLQKWGVRVSNNIILDPKIGLDIRSQSGGVVKHPGILGLGAGNLDREDVTTANLEVINGASVGAISLSNETELSLQPIIKTSTNATEVDALLYLEQASPEALQRLTGNASNTYIVAGKITGKANSAYSLAPEETEHKHIANTNGMKLVVVADSDLLADRYWVQQSNFFGQPVYTPFANNGDFITNLVENMAGSNALISIRSRGSFVRPFTTVNDLELKAEKRFREQEELLQQQLLQTEERLAQLQGQQDQSGSLVMTSEQQDTIDEFVQQRVEIRKKLREVRYELERDIDALGNFLKFTNTAAAPVVLVCLLYLAASALRRRAGKQWTAGRQ